MLLLMRHQRKWGCNPLDLFYSINPLFVIGDLVNKSLEKTNCMNNRGVQVCSKFPIKSCVLSKLHGRLIISLNVF
jgi:hypothetical protein